MPTTATTFLRASLLVTSALAVLLVAMPPASGAPDDKKAEAKEKDDKKACFASYEQSQQLRKEGKLRASKTELATCAREVCPKALRADCQRWLDEVQASVPTVVIEGIAGNGADTTSIRVSIDGAVVADQLDGRAIEVDPGPHTFRYDLGGKSKEERIVILEGDRNRKIRASFAPDAPAAVPAVTPTTTAPPADTGKASPRPIPLITYVFAGTAVVGAGVFAVFALSGKSKESSLSSSCKPNCTSSDVSSLKTTFLVGDIGLAVGIVSLGLATTTFLLRRPSTDPGVALDVSPVHGGAVIKLGGSL